MLCVCVCVCVCVCGLHTLAAKELSQKMVASAGGCWVTCTITTTGRERVWGGEDIQCVSVCVCVSTNVERGLQFSSNGEVCLEKK